MNFNHLSVMADEVTKNLVTNRNGIYVDCTLGGGGHSLLIAENLDDGLIVGIDQDQAAIESSKIRLEKISCKKIFVQDNFSHLEKILSDREIDFADGFLFDLGVSSYQIDTAERGFSYIHNAPLDMRMNQSQKFSARDVVNNYDEENLYKIFHEYGEEKFSNRIAKTIINARKIKSIETTGELVKIIESVVPFNKKSGHPAKRIFQAIRIEVNNELNILQSSIETAVNHLKSGGRIAIITFHSLEDRIVKNTFKIMASDCICPKDLPICVCNHKAQIKILSKAVTATEEELKKNSRAKSAKLRIAEKI